MSGPAARARLTREFQRPARRKGSTKPPTREHEPGAFRRRVVPGVVKGNAAASKHAVTVGTQGARSLSVQDAGRFSPRKCGFKEAASPRYNVWPGSSRNSAISSESVILKCTARRGKFRSRASCCSPRFRSFAKDRSDVINAPACNRARRIRAPGATYCQLLFSECGLRPSNRQTGMGSLCLSGSSPAARWP